MSAPFVVLALPRSRTAWLANFLSYRDYHCAHEQMRYLRGLEDARLWLSQDFTGTAETTAARWWRLIRHYRPDAKILVVRRPRAEVIDSLLRLDLRPFSLDRALLTRTVERGDRALDQVARHAMTVSFDDLTRRDICKQVFEHCLPYQFDPVWWASIAPVNIQCDVRKLIRYALTHTDRLAAVGSLARRQMRGVLGARLSERIESSDGVTIQRERLATFKPDAEALFIEHCKQVGEPADQWLRKNWPLLHRLEDAGVAHIITARSNGRMLGYLACVIGPSLEEEGLMTATQTVFFASPDADSLRLSLRLQRASLDMLRELGVGEVHMRAGVRGSGPKLGTLYKHLGAEEFGQLYRLKWAA